MQGVCGCRVVWCLTMRAAVHTELEVQYVLYARDILELLFTLQVCVYQPSTQSLPTL